MDWIKITTNTCLIVVYACAFVVIFNRRTGIRQTHRLSRRSVPDEPTLEWINPMEVMNEAEQYTVLDEEHHEFDWTTNDSPMIPHIIHQMWNNNTIPDVFHVGMKKWSQLHPRWQHWFWTLDDVRLLIRDHYPDFLELFDEYPTHIHKADAARLFVIHHYGGVYVDLDAVPIKAFDDWTYNYHCLVTQETGEHTFIIRDERVPSVINTVLACRPGHPFYRTLLGHLQEYYDRYQMHFLQAAGAVFYDTVFKRYNNGSSVVQGLKRGADVTVVPPQYFLPSYDPSQKGMLDRKCHPFAMQKLSEQGQNLCLRLRQRFFDNVVPPEAYMDHHWVHTYMQSEETLYKDALPIHMVIPGAINVTTMLQVQQL